MGFECFPPSPNVHIDKEELHMEYKLKPVTSVFWADKN
jgi:hypothetical protein